MRQTPCGIVIKVLMPLLAAIISIEGGEGILCSIPHFYGSIHLPHSIMSSLQVLLHQ